MSDDISTCPQTVTVGAAKVLWACYKAVGQSYVGFTLVYCSTTSQVGVVDITVCKRALYES